MVKVKIAKLKTAITDKARSLNLNSLDYQSSLEQLLVAVIIKLDSP